MGNVQDHITQWKHNRVFLSSISHAYPDWVVTVAFYVALHAVDALLAFDGVQRIHSHSGRNEVLLRTNKYRAINSKYLTLYDLSRTVRYLAAPRDWVPADRVQHEVIERLLYPIEASVQRFIKMNLGLPEIHLSLS